MEEKVTRPQHVEVAEEVTIEITPLTINPLEGRDPTLSQ